jgi:hypothetical protein
VTGRPPPLALWRVVMLNSNCKLVACSAGSPQERFLANALATTPKGACVAAAWHHPRYSWQFIAEGGAVRDSGTAACRAVR